MRPCKLTPLLCALLTLMVSLTAACGDEDNDDEGIVCRASKPVVNKGTVGDYTATYTRSSEKGNLNAEMEVGERNGQRVVVLLDEFPNPIAEDEMVPMLISFQTNVTDPNGSNISENILRRIDSSGSTTFQVVQKAHDEYCNVGDGEICVRVSIDETDTRNLSDENRVVFEGISGTVTFSTWNSNTLAAEWDVEFGPLLSSGETGSQGSLQGCFEASTSFISGGIEKIRVPGS